MGGIAPVSKGAVAQSRHLLIDEQHSSKWAGIFPSKPSRESQTNY
jgi:hypothetical protein